MIVQHGDMEDGTLIVQHGDTEDEEGRRRLRNGKTTHIQ